MRVALLIFLFLEPLAWSQETQATPDMIEQGQKLAQEFQAEMDKARETKPEDAQMKNKNWFSTWSLIGLFTFGVTNSPDANAQKRLYNGGRGPGGGDVLLCKKSNDNSFKGEYSYDYIQTRNSLHNENEDEFDFPKDFDCADRMDYIADRLASVNPVMAEGLRDFIQSVPFSGGETSTIRRRWVPSGSSEKSECHSYDIKDETHLVKADNCQTCQLFNRDYSRTRPQIFYTYNAGLFNDIQKRPTQCSYALIHEWARDFLPDSKDIYFFTSSLHSKKFLTHGDLSLIPLDQQTESCFEMSKHAPAQTDKLDIYFKISSLVPPTQDEVERYQGEMMKMTKELDRKIDVTIDKMRKNRPIGYNERQVEYMAKKAQFAKMDVMMNLDDKKISYAQAYDELKLIESTLPSYKPIEHDMGMIFLMDATPMGSFVRSPKDSDRMPSNIEIIEAKPVNR